MPVFEQVLHPEWVTLLLLCPSACHGNTPTPGCTYSGPVAFWGTRVFSSQQPFGCAKSVAHSELYDPFNLSPCSEWRKRHTLMQRPCCPSQASTLRACMVCRACYSLLHASCTVNMFPSSKGYMPGGCYSHNALLRLESRLLSHAPP